MEDSCKTASEINPAPEDTDTTAEVKKITSSTPSTKGVAISSQTLFPESPVYEPDEEMDCTMEKDTVIIADDSVISEPKEEQTIVLAKRKLSDEGPENSAKLLKLDCVKDDDVNTLTLDDEVSKINENPVIDLELPSTSRLRTPIRSSPRKITKRSNSSEVKLRTPKTPKVRAASADITKERTTPRKINLGLLKTKFIIEEENIIKPENSKSRPSVEFVREIPPPTKQTTNIEENSAELNDSQNLHLVLSPSIEENESIEIKTRDLSSDVVIVTDREEVVDPGKIKKSHSEGYAYSDESNNLSQLKPKDCIKDKNTDQESTDSVCSMSPDHVPTVASKMISKLSNGNSSTPTELSAESKNMTNDSDVTPDMVKLNRGKGKKGKNESFRSDNTTPSTISPLQNGHSLPIATPQVPVFDVHMCNSEEGEFLSLYIVRTDNELGLDMCKEYQRLSKRYTIDPYLADVSTSNSPSSVTSGGMINLPNRTSYASTVSSTSTSSNRTSDGTFVVPQAPRKSVSNPTTTVKGYDGLMRKLQDIFSHIREYSIDEGNRSSSDDKVSVGVQVLPSSESTASLSNGNASPEEISKCDKTTPKSSLKKSKVRGRRPLLGKTKRTILPTQAEEPEFMHGMNSPEMVPMNGDGDKSPVKSPKDEKPPPASVGTPKSVIKLKQKRGPTSPRPATPVEKSLMKQEFPGYAPDTVVLAKWVDKRYYSGKVLEITEPNKYLIKFDDGQSKVLLDDFIIFGDTKRLPLKGQSVCAMVDEEQTYEPGLVLDVEENDSGTVMYRCTTDGDTVVMVTGSELYLTEDQARSLKESARARSPAAPGTPRHARRAHRELDLDNIIQGPRSARSRDKGSSSARKRVMSPKSPKASTSGLKTKMATPTGSSRKRVPSESSELSESSNSAPPARIEEVAGVEPEVQRTPRKIDGVKAGPLQLKGAARQTAGAGKKNSKLAKFENDEHTVSTLGPIPGGGSALFAGRRFLLTCADTPSSRRVDKESQDARQYSSEEDGEPASQGGTDTEDLEFTSRPFNKERLKAQIEAGGGIVHSHFDDVPPSAYSTCHLIAPRPCLTAKYILCLAAGVRAVSHAWLVTSCLARRPLDVDAFALPAGWSVLARRFIDWTRDTPRPLFFKDKTILLCGEQETFVKFWERVCSLVGACTRTVNDQDLNMSGAYALVTEWDCPHEVQNKANQEGVPLVSTVWVVQCLIESRVIPPASHEKFSFMYTEPE